MPWYVGQGTLVAPTVPAGGRQTSLIATRRFPPLPGAERLIDGFVNGVVQATHRGIPKHKVDAGGMLAREIVKVVLGIVGCVIADTNVSYPLRLGAWAVEGPALHEPTGSRGGTP